MYRESSGDAFGYYVYLPAFFIHHDLATLHTTMTAKYSHCCPGAKADSISHDKYFIGTAILQAPFFLLAHFVAGCFHQARDGFSMIYMYAVVLSCFTYVLLALFLLIPILRRRFSDGVVAIVIMIIGLGTNLYFAVVCQAPFCHPYLFFLYSLLVFFTAKFYESNRRRYIILIGFAYGMIVVTRSNELYAVFIPLLWGLRSKKDITDRFQLLQKFIWPVCLACVVMVLCYVPQILYWKASSGQYIYYSYQKEGFNFFHPHIWDGIFSACNGWLVYSPLMILSLAGIWIFFRAKDVFFIPVIVFLLAHIYVIYSWWCWSYIGSYGSRPMIEAYAVLSIPLAYSIEWFGRSYVGKFILASITAFFVWLVMFQAYQTSLAFFCSELSKGPYNVVSFGKVKVTDEEFTVMDCGEFQPESPGFIKLVAENNFVDSTLNGSDSIVFSSGRRSICVHPHQCSPGCTIPYGKINGKPEQWIKASVNCFAKQQTSGIWGQSKIVISMFGKNKEIKYSYVTIPDKIDNPEHSIWSSVTNKWSRVYFYSRIPNNIDTKDTIMVYVEGADGPDIYIDDLKVELYEGARHIY